MSVTYNTVLITELAPGQAPFGTPLSLSGPPIFFQPNAALQRRCFGDSTWVVTRDGRRYQNMLIAFSTSGIACYPREFQRAYDTMVDRIIRETHAPLLIGSDDTEDFELAEAERPETLEGILRGLEATLPQEGDARY